MAKVYPTYNDIAPSYGDLNVTAQGRDMTELIRMSELKGINTSAALEVGKAKVAGRTYATTRGDANYECSLTHFSRGYDLFLKRLAETCIALGADFVDGDTALVGLVHFDLYYAHTPPGTTRIDECYLRGCRYLGRTKNTTQGTDPNEVESTIHVTEIIDVVDGQKTRLI